MKKIQLIRSSSKYLATALILLGVCGCMPNDPYSSSPHLKTTVTTASSGNTITSTEAKGNLEVTHALKCMSFQSVMPEHTPADLHGAIQDCVKKGDYESALGLFKVAGSYAVFDTLRVTDKTAHQAKTALSVRTHLAFSKEERGKFAAYAKKHELQTTSLSLCQNIRKLGPPTYYPSYMIQHGLGAISGDKTNPLVKDFNAEKAWVKSLEVYLHCKP